MMFFFNFLESLIMEGIKIMNVREKKTNSIIIIYFQIGEYIFNLLEIQNFKCSFNLSNNLILSWFKETATAWCFIFILYFV